MPPSRCICRSPRRSRSWALGRKNLRLIPVDGDFRMRTDALAGGHRRRPPGRACADRHRGDSRQRQHRRDRSAAGNRRIWRSGKALWLHVDGAFGGLAALAAPEKYRGMDRADTLSIDAHKWLYQPLDCGCLLHRHRDVGARGVLSHRRLCQDAHRRFHGRLRGFRGIDGAVAAFPRAEALDVAAVSRAPGLSRRHRAGPALMPSCWRNWSARSRSWS